MSTYRDVLRQLTRLEHWAQTHPPEPVPEYELWWTQNGGETLHCPQTGEVLSGAVFDARFPEALKFTWDREAQRLAYAWAEAALIEVDVSPPVDTGRRNGAGLPVPPPTRVAFGGPGWPPEAPDDHTRDMSPTGDIGQLLTSVN